MIKSIPLSSIILLASFIISNSQSNNLKNLSKLFDPKTQSISPENFTGEKGKDGMAALEGGIAAKAARKSGQAWKVNPYFSIKASETFTQGEINEYGIINHIWMTPVGKYRLMILCFYWDDETEPSVELPVDVFFAADWGFMNESVINSAIVAVNPRSGYNSYLQIPFRKSCKITMENLSEKEATFNYQINYSLEKVHNETI